MQILHLLFQQLTVPFWRLILDDVGCCYQKLKSKFYLKSNGQCPYFSQCCLYITNFKLSNKNSSLNWKVLKIKLTGNEELSLV